MRKAIVGVLLGVLLAVPASAQDEKSATDRVETRHLRLDDVSAISEARPAPTPVPKRSGDSLKNGAIAGLIVGGVIGAALAIECGHPECGPLFGMSVGLGAAIGVGVDALFVKTSPIPLGRESGRRRLQPFASGRTIAAGFQKRW
jgi:hypothetical protein